MNLNLVPGPLKFVKCSQHINIKKYFIDTDTLFVACGNGLFSENELDLKMIFSKYTLGKSNKKIFLIDLRKVFLTNFTMFDTLLLPEYENIHKIILSDHFQDDFMNHLSMIAYENRPIDDILKESTIPITFDDISNNIDIFHRYIQPTRKLSDNFGKLSSKALIEIENISINFDLLNPPSEILFNSQKKTLTDLHDTVSRSEKVNDPKNDLKTHSNIQKFLYLTETIYPEESTSIDDTIKFIIEKHGCVHVFFMSFVKVTNSPYIETIFYKCVPNKKSKELSVRRQTNRKKLLDITDAKDIVIIVQKRDVDLLGIETIKSLISIAHFICKIILYIV
jgi:hypothetical protein